MYSLKATGRKIREDIELAKYTINHQKDEILAGIYRKKPDVVGFSCYIWNIEYVLDVAENLRKFARRWKLSWEGLEVSYDAEKMLQRYPFVDLVMVGEGEIPSANIRHFCWAKGRKNVRISPGLC